jgi:hypothetical protein
MCPCYWRANCDLANGDVNIGSGGADCDPLLGPEQANFCSKLWDPLEIIIGENRSPQGQIYIKGANTPNEEGWVNGAQILLNFDDYTTFSSTPIYVEDSDVVITFGANFKGVGVTNADAPAIVCAQNSNITFVTTAGSSYKFDGGINAATIGTDKNGKCGTLRFTGEGELQFTTGLGAAVGAGPATVGEETSVELIEIQDSKFVLSRPADAPSQHGAGIGAGSANGGRSIVKKILIHNGTFVGPKEDGDDNVGFATPIGAGEASGRGTENPIGVSRVENIVIEGGNFLIGAPVGAAGIGTSTSSQFGQSSVGLLQITGGDFRGEAGSAGAAIGAGRADGSVSRVDTIDVQGGTFNLKSNLGAVIGTGIGTVSVAPPITVGVSEVGTIAISGSGNLKLDPSRGAGIGAGTPEDGRSYVGTIDISGGEIRTSGTIGAGGADVANSVSSVGTITISGGTIICDTNRSHVTSIGVGESRSSGTGNVSLIEVSGGTLVLRPGTFAAGIGSGYPVEAETRVGTIRVSGGNVNVTSAQGPGIGASASYNGVSSVGTISVTGGTLHIDATEGAGIGAGQAESGGTTSVGTIEVTGGRVFTSSVDGGAGLGAGAAYITGQSKVTVIALGGNAWINAAGNGGAAIGAGQGTTGGTSQVESITITNGTYILAGTAGAGIGAGHATEGTSYVNAISVSTGVFDITARQGAGIGTGLADLKGTSQVYSIVIHNGQFRITSSSGAGIGSANVFGGASLVDIMDFNAGSYTITSSAAAGIGAGLGDGGLSSADIIRIKGGTYRILAEGSSAIGAIHPPSQYSRAQTIRIGSGSFNLRGLVGIGASGEITLGDNEGDGSRLLLSCATAQSYCVGGSYVVSEAGQLTAQLSTRTFFDPGMRTGNDLSQIRNFIALYRGFSDTEPPLRLPILHLAGLASFEPGVHNFTLWNTESLVTREFEVNVTEFPGFAVAATAPGQYKLEFGASTGVRVSVCDEQTETFPLSQDAEHYASVSGRCGVGAAAQVDEGMPPGYTFGVVIVGLLVLGGIVMGIVFCFSVQKFKRARRARRAGQSGTYEAAGDTL